MNIERNTQPYTKYINRKLWEQALESKGDEAKELDEFFKSYHKGPQQLKMAIDNVTLKYFPNLLQCCLESLQFLSKSKLRCYNYFIEQILESSTFEKLFLQELDIMNRKVNQTHDITKCQQFINYFLKFIQNSLQLQLKQLPKYVKNLEQTVSNLKQRNSNFIQEFQKIQDLQNQIDILNNNLSSNYQPYINNNVNITTQQENNSENQYRPRNYQVEFLQDTRQNVPNLPQNQISLNNPTQIQSQQFIQIQPTMNNQQPNQYQPRNDFIENNVKTQQQGYFSKQNYRNLVYNSQFDYENFSEFEMLQLNKYPQIEQNQQAAQQQNSSQQTQQNLNVFQQLNLYSQSELNEIPPQQSNSYSQIQESQPQYSTQQQKPQIQKYQQEKWVVKSQVLEQKSGISGSKQDNQRTQYYQRQQVEYEVKQPTYVSTNSSNSIQQPSQIQSSYVQNSNQIQIQKEITENNFNNSQQEYNQQFNRSSQETQILPFNFENYILDIEYYQKMKNFFQQKQPSQQNLKQKQMDQAYVSYQDCSIEPMVTEFDDVSDKNFVFGGCIFEIPFGQPFKSTELFLNNHFFILREDYLKSFRLVVAKLKQTGFKEIGYQALQGAFLYFDVLIENIEVTNRGFQFIVTMNAYDPKNNEINWQKSTRLMPGSLLLLSTTKLEFMLFGTVISNHKFTQNGRVCIALTLIGLSMKEQLRFVNSLLSQEQQLIAIENKIYFETYTHFLKCLQMIEPFEFPFSDQIVFGSKTMPMPGYLDNQQIKNEGIVYDIDLNFDLHKQKEIGQLQRVNILREWPKVNTESLDDSQFKAIQSIVKNGISLIQGPPGTGKTFCGALGVRILLQNQFKWNQNYNYRNQPILIVCQTNHALDQFLQHILTFCRMEDIVRIGGRCKVKEFEPMLLSFDQTKRKIRFNWSEYFELRDDLDRKLSNLLNLIDNVNYLDVSQYMPDLFERIICQYLEIEDLNFKNPISSKSQKIIIHMWLDNFKPQDEQVQRIIKIENQIGNFLIRDQTNRKSFKPIMIYKFSDLDTKFNLSDEAQQQLNQDDEEDFIDENENLDSDEEENRKVFINYDNYEKDEYIKKLIDDSRTMKRLLNRLSKDNKVSFYNILEEINEKKNYQIWEMTQTKRNVITRFIFSQKFKYLFQILECDVGEYEYYIKQLKQAYIQRDIQYIQTKKIVGVTLAGCAKYAEKLKKLKFNILVVEEAGEVLESNLIAVLSQQINHLILIGDHQQLKPHMECYDLEVKFRANISLFERLIRNGLEYVTLRYQRRMKSKFADFIRLIYSDYQDHSSIQEQNNIHIEGIKTDLLFFDHRHKEDQKLCSSSKQNKFEAMMILRMVDYLLKNKYKGEQITVLTTYLKQALYIKKQCDKNVKVQPIDNYQGEENDIILLSLVRSNDDYKLGFVAIDNRVCVAFSRARLGLYVFGDFLFIEECIKDHLIKDPQKRNPDISDLWLKIIDLAKQKGVIQNCIELQCYSHNIVTKIYEERDWDQVKEGGCSLICNTEFPCGHICQQRCHRSSHNQQDCIEKCEKQLGCDHQCLGKCGQIPCPPCRTMIEIYIIECGHFTQIKCSEQHNKIQCRERCNRMLKCGHQCSLKCMDDCKNNKCLEQITYTLPICKHEISIPCDDQNYIYKLICPKKCSSQLICGHNCSGSCGLCFERFHQPCQQKCDKPLLCGHKCQLLCYSECYKCEDQCQIECNCKIRCLNKCYEKCIPCEKDCQLSCQHSKCTKKCYEICDRKPCNQKCDKKLKCGCDCMGFCGEFCPGICQVDEHDNSKADKDTIYYQLECQCQGILEAEFLDQYFGSQQSNLIHCPKCNQIIWRSSRYQQQVKNSLIQFNNEKENKQMKYQVTYEKVNKAIQLAEQRLQFLKQNNSKDKDSFLDNIIKELKKDFQLINQRKVPKMPYQYFKCIKRQLKQYEKSLELMKCLNDNLIFQIHKNNLIKEYLMSEYFRNFYSKSFWWKVTQKLEILLLYQKSNVQYQMTKDQLFQNISQELEDSNFFLDDQKKSIFEKIFNNPDPIQN